MSGGLQTTQVLESAAADANAVSSPLTIGSDGQPLQKARERQDDKITELEISNASGEAKTHSSSIAVHVSPGEISYRSFLFPPNTETVISDEAPAPPLPPGLRTPRANEGILLAKAAFELCRREYLRTLSVQVEPPGHCQVILFTCKRSSHACAALAALCVEERGRRKGASHRHHHQHHHQQQQHRVFFLVGAKKSYDANDAKDSSKPCYLYSSDSPVDTHSSSTKPHQSEEGRSSEDVSPENRKKTTPAQDEATVIPAGAVASPGAGTPAAIVAPSATVTSATEVATTTAVVATAAEAPRRFTRHSDGEEKESLLFTHEHCHSSDKAKGKDRSLLRDQETPCTAPTTHTETTKESATWWQLWDDQREEDVSPAAAV